MLSTALYDRDLQLIVENMRSASFHHDDAAADRILKHLVRLLDYAKAHGLTLETRRGLFYFKRNGYAPAFLYIETRDDEGWRTCPACGHAWNAHTTWIARREMCCEEARS